MPSFDPDRQILDAVEWFCHEIYLRRCPPMTATDLRSFYLTLKVAGRHSTWPPFEVLIDAVEQSQPENTKMVAERDHYLCGACSHVFVTKKAFSGHLTSVEHDSHVRSLCEQTAHLASSGQGAKVRCPLKGCSQKFRNVEALTLHAVTHPHYLFFVAKADGLNSYACINCVELFKSKRSLVQHATSCTEPSFLVLESATSCTEQSLSALENGGQIELEITSNGKTTGVDVIKTASGFEVAQYKSNGRATVKCCLRNISQTNVTITNIEYASSNQPPFIMHDHLAELSSSNAGGCRIVLEPGHKHDFYLTAENLNRYGYGFYEGSLHVLYTSLSPDEITTVVDWNVTLEVISSEHEELKPISKFQPKKTNPWVRVPTVDSRHPQTDISNRLEQLIPLPECEVPENVRTMKIHALPEVSEQLTPENYQSKMKGMLYLEELALEKMMQSYTIESATLQEDQDYFLLEVLGALEQKPQIKIGTKLRLIPTMNSSDGQSRPKGYIGYVYDIEGAVARLRFAGSFQQRYVEGMKFIVEFPLHRQNLQLYHRALSMAEYNPGLMHSVIFPKALLRSGADDWISATGSRGIRTKNKLVEKNPEQMKAVAAILDGTSLPHPYVIFGPPGTGKTTTVVEAIKQIYFRHEKSRVLVCTPQNNAADLVTKRLLEHVPPAKLIRMNAIHRKKSDVLYKEVVKVSNYEPSGEVFFPSIEELSEKRIVVSTLSTCGRLVSADIGTSFFTHIFIDESGQAIEPEVLIAVAGLLRTNSVDAPPGQLVLAGDPKQLGPVLQSEAAKSYGLGTSILERLMTTCDLYSKKDSAGFQDCCYVSKLLKNFRSHPAILHTSNQLFYDQELQPCADQLERERFCSWSGLPKKGFPIILHDVSGKDNRESTDPSYFNVAEAETAMDYVEQLLRLQSPKVKAEDIGIISPYKKQVKKIRQVLQKKYQQATPPVAVENIKVGSVEEFQGQERSVIIISTVRAESRTGFVNDPKRFNVATTRAKSLLIVICNVSLLSTSGPWKSLIDYCRENGGVRAARI